MPPSHPPAPPKIKLKFKTGPNAAATSSASEGEEDDPAEGEASSATTAVEAGREVKQPLKLKLSLGTASQNVAQVSPLSRPSSLVDQPVLPSAPKLKLSFSAPVNAAASSSSNHLEQVAPAGPSSTSQPNTTSRKKPPRPKARSGSVLGPSRGGKEPDPNGEDVDPARSDGDGDEQVGDHGNEPRAETATVPKITLKLPTTSANPSPPNPTSSTTNDHAPPSPSKAIPPSTNPTPTSSALKSSTNKKVPKSRGNGWNNRRKPRTSNGGGAPAYQVAEEDGSEFIGTIVVPASGKGALDGRIEMDRAEEEDGPARKRIKLSDEPGSNDVPLSATDSAAKEDLDVDMDDKIPYADAYEAPQAFVDARFPDASGSAPTPTTHDVDPAEAGNQEEEEEDRKPDIYLQAGHMDEKSNTPRAAAVLESRGGDTSRDGTPMTGVENDNEVGTPGTGNGGLEYGYNFTPGGTPGPGEEGDGFAMMDLGGEQPIVKKQHWSKTKKSLKEVMKKVVADMKRKDGYGLFLDPVDEVEYPGYFQAIGGRENAMDLATMDRKLDAGRYRSVDEFEADIEKMISAAETFNAEDSLVAREASKMRVLAKKHVFRSRPIVRTPSPEPRDMSGMASAVGTPGGWADSDVFERDVSASMPPGGPGLRSARVVAQEIPLKQLIPEAMFDYPLHSDAARAIAYHQTGGFRFRSARERKGRERWDGQWREWYTEGDKNLREVDDARDYLREGYLIEKLAMPDRVDYQAEVMRAETTWMPAPFLTGVAAEETAPPIPTAPVRHTDIGSFADIPLLYGFKEGSAYTEADVQGKLRNDFVSTETARAVKAEDDSWEAVESLREMATGEDLAGEAYLRSIERFIAGASEALGEETFAAPSGHKRKLEDNGARDRRLKKAKMESSASSDDEGAESTSARDRTAPTTVKAEMATLEVVSPNKADLTPSAIREDVDQSSFDLVTHVRTKWRGGWLDRGSRKAARMAQETYRAIITGDLPHEDQVADREDSVAAIETLLKAPAAEEVPMQSIVEASMRRVAVETDVRTFAARNGGLDLSSLILQQADFSAPNTLGGPPASGLGRHQWFARSLESTANQLLEASRRREQGQLANAQTAMTDQPKLRRLRMDLLALAKNVPVYELRSMTTAEAEKLPTAVRGLIKVVDP